MEKFHVMVMEMTRARLKSIAIAVLLGGLTVAVVSLVYLRWIEQGISANTLSARDIDIDILRSRSGKLKEELQTVQTNLEAKQAEVAQATADLEVQKQALAEAQKKIKDQQSQLSANSAELSKLRNRPPLFTFSVESSTLANAEQKKADVQALVTSAYDVIMDVYSKPYLLHSVTIAFVDNFSNPGAAAEIVISNGASGLSLTIRLKDFDKNDFNDVSSVIHEIIHSFHGISILDPVAYEEGITVAATDAVLEKLIANGSIPKFSPLYVRISSGTYSGTSLTIPRSGSALYSSPSVADYYQLAGYGWLQIYKADKSFFIKFNEAIYNHKRNGEEITEALVKQVALETMPPIIQGQSKEAWLTTKAFALQ